MPVKHYNAWQFNHPDFDRFKGNFGLTCNHEGKVSLVADKMAVRQSIFLLLSTIPGERIRRPDYGCNLYQLTFMPNDPTTHGLAIHYVRQALERWEPRITIRKIDACRSASDMISKIDISLEYEINTLAMNDELVLTMTLM